MATLGELKDRIVRETNRDDLTDAAPTDATAASALTLALCINQAITYYADNKFWFNQEIYPASPATSETVVGQDYVVIPTGLSYWDRLSIEVGGNRYSLRKVALDEWDRQAGYVTSQGQPTLYAVDQFNVRLWPTPSAVYNLVWVAVYDIAPPATDADSNLWTLYADDLIAARTRYLLLRDYFRDVEGAKLAQIAEREALTTLRHLTTKKIATGQTRSRW